jgi:nitrogen fixation protein NifX
MRVAFTSSDGKTVDRHFGMTRDFHVWEVFAESAVFVGTVSAVTSSPDEEDKIAARANAIRDCAIVCTVQIGGPAAAKLVSRRIHPLKVAEDVAVGDLIARLQEVLWGAPPPWLRKALDETRKEG